MPPWRTMCRSEDLKPADLWVDKEQKFCEATLVIETVKAGEVMGDGGKKTTRPFVTFARHPWVPSKPFKLCSTDAMTIEGLVGSSVTEKWKGVAITLYVTKVRSPKSGMVDAIRVRPELPPQPGQEDRRG